jgi:hypothetical protein
MLNYTNFTVGSFQSQFYLAKLLVVPCMYQIQFEFCSFLEDYSTANLLSHCTNISLQWSYVTNTIYLTNT